MKNMEEWIKLLEVRKYPALDKYTNDRSGEQEVDNRTVAEFVKDNAKGLSVRSRKWFFTLHNPQKYFDSWDQFEYRFTMLVGDRGIGKAALEIGKSGKSLHIQGYFSLNSQIKKSTVIKYLGAIGIDLRIARGNDEENHIYITKQEADYDKVIVVLGDWEHSASKTKDFTAYEYARYLFKKNKTFNHEEAQLLCKDYRRNAKSAITEIIIQWRTMRGDLTPRHKPLGRLFITGASGAGKSLLTSWLIRHSGYDENLDVHKKEADNANVKSGKLWFTADSVGKPIVYFSEVSQFFPAKESLLSILDAESKLEIKGGYIDNTFDRLIINTTHHSLYSIYNQVESPVHYIEIARRIAMGEYLFVFPNEEFHKHDTSALTVDEIIEKFPPRIYVLENDAPIYKPQFVNRKFNQQSSYSYDPDKKQVVETMIWQNTRNEYRWNAREITPQEALQYFKSTINPAGKFQTSSIDEEIIDELAFIKDFDNIIS